MTGRGVDGADRGVVDDPVAEFGRHPDRDERGTSGEQPFLGAAVGAERRGRIVAVGASREARRGAGGPRHAGRTGRLALRQTAPQTSVPHPAPARYRPRRR